ncbi:hypothetical protein FNF27_07714 [Cafeteria roenbergensis]|uniref:Uncharacterized protein n=2 Tax=Cafeteria roenbergensis TaxID=33653 RepID=A0A5A8DI61_CAFRO|nr:hypothetical protein FNF27_07714 [Cafeteria roenbergensis]
MAVASGLLARETGDLRAASVCRRFAGARTQALARGNASPVVLDRLSSGITSLEFDSVQQRFLLATTGRGELALYDVEAGASTRERLAAGGGTQARRQARERDVEVLGLRGGQLPAARGALRRRAAAREEERGAMEEAERRLDSAGRGGGHAGGTAPRDAWAAAPTAWRRDEDRAVAERRRLKAMARATAPWAGHEGSGRLRSAGQAPAVLCAAWYGVDSGLVVTGSADGNILAWDVAAGLTLGGSLGVAVASAWAPGPAEQPAVFSLSMHAPHSAGPLRASVAMGRAERAVRLLDLRSGAATHSLDGHSGDVLATAWHPQREHELASGSADGGVLVWDVRLGGTRACLAQMDLLTRRPTLGGGGGGGGGAFGAPGQPGVSKRAHSGPVTAVSWGLADGAGVFLLSAGGDSCTLGPMALQAARHAAYRELDALLPRDGWNLAAVGGSAHVSAELPADVAVPPGQSGSRRFPRELSDVLCEAFALTDRKIIVPTPDSSPDRAWTAQEAGQLVRCVALSSEVAPFDTSAFRAADATSRVLVPGLHASSRSWRGMVRARTPLPAYLALAAHQRIVSMARRDSENRELAVAAALEAWSAEYTRQMRLMRSTSSSVAPTPAASESGVDAATSTSRSALSRAGSDIISMGSAMVSSQGGFAAARGHVSPTTASEAGSQSGVSLLRSRLSVDTDAQPAAASAVAARELRTVLRCFSPIRLGDSLTLFVGGDPTLPAAFRSSNSAKRFRAAMSAGRAEAVPSSPLSSSSPARGRSHVVSLPARAEPGLRPEPEAITMLQLLRWWTPARKMSDMHSAVCAILEDPMDLPGPVSPSGCGRSPASSARFSWATGSLALQSPLGPSPSATSAARPSFMSSRASSLARSISSVTGATDGPACSSAASSVGSARSSMTRTPARSGPVGPQKYAVSSVQHLFDALCRRHPDLATIAADERRRPRYTHFVAAFCIGALRGHTATFVTERDLRQSNLVEALAACATHSLEKLVPFAPDAFARCESRFNGAVKAALESGVAGAVLPCTGDRSSEPSVSVDAFLAFRSSLSLAAAEAETANAPFAAEWAVRRVASGLARPLASGRPGYLAFDDFVWLALAEEDRMAGASIGFWCRVLDTDDDGFIGALDVAAAMRHRKLEGGLAAACATPALGAGSLAGEAAAEEAAESQADCGCSALEQSTAALLLRDCFGPAGCITPFRVTAALVRRRRCGAILYRMLIEGVAAGGAD